MTAATELLDQLDALRAAGTPGEWLQHPSDGEYVIADVSEDGDSYSDVADTYAFRKKTGYADAALIVAAVNTLPQLTAALRAVLGVMDRIAYDAVRAGTDAEANALDATLARLRQAITAALSPAEAG